MGNKNQIVLKKIKDQLIDIDDEGSNQENVKYISIEDPQAEETLNHSGAHLLAQAVLDLFPDVQYGIGPAVEKGFYYDFLTQKPFTPEDITNIKKKDEIFGKSECQNSKTYLVKKNSN